MTLAKGNPADLGRNQLFILRRYKIDRERDLVTAPAKAAGNQRPNALAAAADESMRIEE